MMLKLGRRSFFAGELFSATGLLFSGLVASLALLPVTAQAQVFDNDYTQESDMLLKGAIGLFSDRDFRGQTLYDGTSIQGRAEAGIGTGFGLFYIGGFMHFSDDKNHGGEDEKSFNEFDFELGHRFYFEEMALSMGHRWLTYSRTTERLRDTGEFFAELTTEVIAHPHFMATYDHDEHDGWYYEFGLEQPVPLGLDQEQHSIVPSVKVAMSSSLDGGSHPIYDDDGIAFVEVGLRGVFVLTDSVTLEPEMHFTEDIDDATESDFVFGVNLAGEIGEKQ